MSVTRVQTNQLRTLNALEKLGIVVDDTIETVLAQLNKEADTPLRISPSSPADLTINIGSIRVQRGDNVTETVSPINSLIPNFTGGSVQFPASSGTIVVTGGSNETLPTLSNNESINVGISLSSAGNLQLSFGAVYANVADQYLPANQPTLPPNELPIGIVLVRKNASGNLQGNNSAVEGEFQNGDIIQFTASGSGGGGGFSEQALLFQMLADNNMENIAFGSFDGETVDIIQSATNMNLDQSTGSYIPSATGEMIQWSGSRLPNVGATGTTFTANLTGTVTAITTNVNELTIVDAVGGVGQYTYDFTSAADDYFYIDWTVRLPSWSTYVTDSGGDANTYVGLEFKDGQKIVQIFFVRENGTTGDKLIKITDSIGSELTDIDGNAANYSVDWTQEHQYEFFGKRGGIAHLYVDGQLAFTVDLSAIAGSTADDSILFGSFSNSSTAGTHVWREFNFRRFRASLETKVLNYRGSFAFEGDGTPTAATSAGTIQEITGSNDLFTEDNWDAADSSVLTNATITTVNAGEPNARLQAVLPGSAQMYYQWDLDTDTNVGANPYISSRVKLVDVDNVSADDYNFLGIQLNNRDIRLVGEYFDANTFDLKLSGVGIDVSQETTGEAFRLAEGEEAVIELRVVNHETVQFLVNGQIQQECEFEVFGTNPTGNQVWIGTVANNDAGDSLTWQWSEVRIGDSNADSFLAKNPIEEAIAVLDLEANVSTWISISTDGGIKWTAPKKIGIDGSSPLISIPSTFAGGKIKARILSYGNDDARINNLALLYNSSIGSDGLATQFVKTYDASDFTSEPGDQVLQHNLKAAEDEILLFGGTEFLTKDLDWYHIDSDRLLIKNAVSGVPYEVRRIGFNFGETKNTVVVDRATRPAIGEWQAWTPTYSAGNAMTFTSVTTYEARYRVVGNAVQFHIHAEGTTGGVAESWLEATLPIQARTNLTSSGVGPYNFTATVQDGVAASAADTGSALLFLNGGSSTLRISKFDDSNFGLGANREFFVSGWYEIDEADGYFEDVVTNISNVGNNDTGVLLVKRKTIEAVGEWQDWTPTISATGSMTWTTTQLNFARYRVVGSGVEIALKVTGTTGGSASPTVLISLPITPKKQQLSETMSAMIRLGTGQNLIVGGAIYDSFNNSLNIRRPDGTNWTLGTGRDIFVNGFYEIEQSNGYFQDIVESIEGISDASIVDLSGTQNVDEADFTITDNLTRYVTVKTGASNRTITLPTATGNRVITVSKQDAGAGFVICNGVTLRVQYDQVTFVSVGSSWVVLNSDSRPIDFQINGYARLPNGLIVQWGTINGASNTNLTATFPIVFPNAALQATATVNVTTSFTAETGIQGLFADRIVVNHRAGTSTSIRYVVFGY